MASFPFRLFGGATRPDAISGLNPDFSRALLDLYTAAPRDVQSELGLNSAYRSPAVQKVLWDRSDKTGHSVAPPGKSRHNFGTAADLYGFGLTKDSVSQATKDWVRQNAGGFGLTFPMSHEPWHIQLAGGARPLATEGRTMALDTSRAFRPDAPQEGERSRGGGLLAEMMQPVPIAEVPNALPQAPSQAGASGQSLPEYIQQFIAMQMRGRGGQGLG
ncbi:MAG: M15 family metallopeptidase [Pseudoxanthomonas sp.]